MRSKKPASTYSPALKREVPSAQVGLTSLFEMVRGGPNRHRHRKRWFNLAFDYAQGAVKLSNHTGGWALAETPEWLEQCFDWKCCIDNISNTIEVVSTIIISLRVISTTWLWHHCLYTYSLSTLSSSTTLKRYLILRRVSYLDAFSTYLIHT